MVATQRSGEIASRPLPSLLLDLYDEAATGTLSLRRAGVVKTVELRGGAPVRVTSTLRDETLGHFLVKGGVISEAQHRDAVQRAAHEGKRLGETLVAMGVLHSDELVEQLHDQDRHKLVAALRWPQGAWRFEPKEIAATEIELPMVELVLTGLRDSGATVLDRLRRFDGASYELTPRGRELVPELRRSFGEAVVEALVRGGAITAIERACADRFLARNALDAVELCGGVSAQRLPAATLDAVRGQAVESRPPAKVQSEPQPARGGAARRPMAIPRITELAGMEPASGPPVRTPVGAVPAPPPGYRPMTVTAAAAIKAEQRRPASAASAASMASAASDEQRPRRPSAQQLPAGAAAAPTAAAASTTAAEDAASSSATSAVRRPSARFTISPPATQPRTSSGGLPKLAHPAQQTPAATLAALTASDAQPAHPSQPAHSPPAQPSPFAAHPRAAVHPAAPPPAAAPAPTPSRPTTSPIFSTPSSRAATSPRARVIVPPAGTPSASTSGTPPGKLGLEASFELDLDLERELDADASRTTTRREAWLPRAEPPETTDALGASGAPEASLPHVPSGPVSSGPHDPLGFRPLTITNAAASRTAAPPWAGASAHPLYDLLFDEPLAHADDGATPLTSLEASSDSVSPDELDAANEHSDAAMRMRRALVAEAQRIRTADLYTILMIDRGATEAQIAIAITERQRAFSRDYYSRFALGFDRPRLEEVLASYATARNTLLDDDARRTYDRALEGAETAAAHTMDAEVAFREAEDLLARQRFPEAITLLENLVARAPAQADFHAALGWAHWLYKGPSASAGDAARPHLNRALEIDPEHVAAHVHRGIVGTSLGEDDAEVLFYLERALELQPARADALEHLEPILIRRGELRRLERLYKRLLFRLSSNFAVRAAEIWLGLAQLYAHHLDEHEAAAIALGNAEALAPSHPSVVEIAQQVRAATIAPRHPLEAARAQLRRHRDADAASELIRSAGKSGQHDAAFLTAATMVALGTADARMVLTYERHRPRGARLPDEPLAAEHWAKLRHPDDVTDLGLLIDIVAPAIYQLAPIELADAGIDPSMRVADHELPAAFGRLRKRLAHLLGVAPCPVYARPELERHIELIACDPPALIAGDEALTAPERPELVCRLARAMSNAQPGRAVGGSRSGTELRAIVLAVIREASYSAIGGNDPMAAAADSALDVLDIEARGDARAAALRLLARGNGLNLSVWSHSLPRTADRAGLLLCGDIPTAVAIAKESGNLERDLIEFAFSAEHAALRADLGLSVEE